MVSGFPRIGSGASHRRNAKYSTLVPQQPATLDDIRNALAALVSDAQEGERVFIYYSGHASRPDSPSAAASRTTWPPIAALELIAGAPRRTAQAV